MAESFFVGQTVYWGDWHREEGLGPQRAARAVATASSLCSVYGGLKVLNNQLVAYLVA
jgi:hypothetical protein